jgi:antitoxin component YwqK of YwqJK toxin-antitoxin module
MRKGAWVILASLLLLPGCGFSPDQIDAGKITSINIIDYNGMSETINSRDRLNAYDNIDFLNPQPYQKVLRVYGRQENGDIPSCITSYHPNGQIKQYLEAVNNRAFGIYKEWYPTGKVKIETNIIGGVADINTHAEESWLFDGMCSAWDENGKLIAEIPYDKGELQGDTFYYHPNGKLWKICPYNKNLPHGVFKIFLEDGELLQTLSYKEGEKDGEAVRYWNKSQIAYKEVYEKGLLQEGLYFRLDGKCLASIQEGSGYRAIFAKNELQEMQHYQNGIQEGEVKVYDEKLNLIAIYSVKEGEKQGEEIHYFPPSTTPKLLLTWQRGVLLNSRSKYRRLARHLKNRFADTLDICAAL